MKTAEEFLREAYQQYDEIDPQNFWIPLHKTIEYMESYAKQHAKDELTKFIDFLLKNGYCDSDVYSEPPSAIDRYMHPELNR